jgi:hypothetical protein
VNGGKRMKALPATLFLLELLFFVASMLNILIFKISRKVLVLLLPPAIAAVLGLILSVLTIRQQVSGVPKVFLLITGFAPGAMFISVLLHNFVSGVVMKITGREFEDAVFFILALFVCPAAFVVGAVGTIVLWIINP